MTVAFPTPLARMRQLPTPRTWRIAPWHATRIAAAGGCVVQIDALATGAEWLGNGDLSGFTASLAIAELLRCETGRDCEPTGLQLVWGSALDPSPTEPGRGPVRMHGALLFGVDATANRPLLVACISSVGRSQPAMSWAALCAPGSNYALAAALAPRLQDLGPLEVELVRSIERLTAAGGR